MLTNTTEIGTATLPRRRLTIPAPTDVSPSAPRRPPRFPALAQFASAARRVPRAPIPVAVALAVLAVLATVAPEPAAAQTVTTFISNTGQRFNTGGGKVQAVAFTTGTGTYTLSSVGIVVDMQSGSPTPAVKIYGDSGGNPGTTLLATMTNPGTFETAAVNSFTAPANTTLSASTTYWVVTSNSAATDGQGFRVGLTINTTLDTGLDTGTAPGWSLGNARSKDDIAAPSWNHSTRPTRRIRFEIRGTSGTTTNNSVPADWSLKPTAVAAGTQFRLLFLSSTTSNASSTDIADYNTFIQTRAAAGHTDIQAYSAGFRVVGCTAAVDARDNTATTYTTTDKGVPIYWLNGAKAADQYEDFYDGSWDDEANDKNESGTNGPDTSEAGNWPLTGCSHDGTEQWPLGASQVSVGRPNSSGSGHGPLFANAQITSGVSSLLYGLSAVFEVAAAVVVPNNPPAFSADTAARSVAENTAAGQNVGAALTATDADSDTLTYTLEGTDAASFDIVSGSGQIRTRTGVTYNHEAKSTHTVVVKADDGNGGTDTVTVTITVTDVDEPPGQPAAPSVSATAGSTTSLDVTWTAPTNTGPAITSYDLQYRAGTSGNFTNGPQNVTGTSAAIGSLAADTSYEVQVRATNAEGDGDWSVAGTGRTTATSAPGAPTGLTATASGTTQINLSWSAPASTGGSAITGYKIEVSPDGTSGWTDQVADTSSTATTYAHTGLAPGDTRHYRVSAINTNGAGTASNVDSATTGTSVPGAPTGLTATASGATQINLSWSAPGSTGGSAITGYKIEVSPDRGLAHQQAPPAGPTRSPTPAGQHNLSWTTTPATRGLTPGWAAAPPATTASPPSTPTAPAPPPTSPAPPPAPPCPAPRPASRPRPAGPPRSTSPGAPRPAPAAPPSPATRSRSPPTRHLQLDQPRRQHEQYHHHLRAHRADRRRPRATTASPPSTPTAPAPPPTSTAPPRTPPPPAPRPASRPRPAGPPRSTSPGAPRAAPAAPPSPATGSRSPPMAPPAGPTSSPTRAIPPPPTRTPG